MLKKGPNAPAYVKPVSRFSLSAMIGLLIALMALSTPAATLASYGQDDQVIEACLLNLTEDTVRMFWRGPDGSVLGSFDRLSANLTAQDEKLICATKCRYLWHGPASNWPVHRSR